MAELTRHKQGRKRFARILHLWFEQSMLDPDRTKAMNAFCRAAEYALGSNRLHATQLSGLINGTQKQISVYTFEALGALSEMAASYHDPLKKKELYEKLNGNPSHYLEKIGNLLNSIPPISYGGNWADNSDFADLFLGKVTFDGWRLQDQWNGRGWTTQISLLTDQPEEDAVATGSLAQGLRNLLAAAPGDMSDKVAQLISIYPDSISQQRIQKIKLVAFNVPGDDEFTPEEEQLEAMSLCNALSFLCKQEISVNDVRKAAQIAPVASEAKTAAA